MACTLFGFVLFLMLSNSIVNCINRNVIVNDEESETGYDTSWIRILKSNPGKFRNKRSAPSSSSPTRNVTEQTNYKHNDDVLLRERESWEITREEPHTYTKPAGDVGESKTISQTTDKPIEYSDLTTASGKISQPTSGFNETSARSCSVLIFNRICVKECTPANCRVVILPNKEEKNRKKEMEQHKIRHLPEKIADASEPEKIAGASVPQNATERNPAKVYEELYGPKYGPRSRYEADSVDTTTEVPEQPKPMRISCSFVFLERLCIRRCSAVNCRVIVLPKNKTGYSVSIQPPSDIDVPTSTSTVPTTTKKTFFLNREELQNMYNEEDEELKEETSGTQVDRNNKNSSGLFDDIFSFTSQSPDTELPSFDEFSGSGSYYDYEVDSAADLSDIVTASSPTEGEFYFGNSKGVDTQDKTKINKKIKDSFASVYVTVNYPKDMPDNTLNNGVNVNVAESGVQNSGFKQTVQLFTMIFPVTVAFLLKKVVVI